MYIFIGGIPASGKSYLAKKVAAKTRAFHLDIDTLRKEMAKDPKLEYWVNILPHLAKRDFNFPGIYLLGQSFEEIFEMIL